LPYFLKHNLPFVALCLLFAGCAKKPPPVEPVDFNGTVRRFDKRPLPVFVLRFFPEDAANKSYRPTMTVTEGKFSDKILPGKYQICMVIPNQDGGTGAGAVQAAPTGDNFPDPVLAPYLDANQPIWTIIVPPEGLDDVVLEIKQIR
jgi:hypothetical protein